jgi:hypothetical protein
MRRALTIVALAVALGLVGGVVVDSQPAYAWYGCGPAWTYPACGPAFCYAPYGCGPAWCPPPMKMKKRGVKGKGKPAEKAKKAPMPEKK